MLITSLENDRIKGYIKLKERKNRKKNNEFLVEGEHLVLEACKKGIVKEIILEQESSFITDIPIIYVTKEIINKISDLETPSNIMAVCKMKEDKIIGNKLLLLDDIQDPGNLGTIIRSSVAFNVTDIILGVGCVDLYNDKVIRSTQGLMFNINIVRTNIKDLIIDLKDKGYLILGTNVKDGCDVSTIATNKYALIMGNEGNGVKKEISEMCDKNIYIEMNNNCESLNVGVATSIILYELNR